MLIDDLNCEAAHAQKAVQYIFRPSSATIAEHLQRVFLSAERLIVLQVCGRGGLGCDFDLVSWSRSLSDVYAKTLNAFSWSRWSKYLSERSWQRSGLSYPRIILLNLSTWPLICRQFGVVFKGLT